MTKVKNIAPGPRGIHSATGELVMLEPGQERDIELAEGEEPGEWFEFDGKPNAARPASAPAVDTAAIEALTRRAEEAETMVELLQDELSKLRRSAPIVAAAVDQLDHANDDHWTKDGEPKVDAVKAIVNGEVSRADIEAATPGFDRAAAKAKAEAAA